MKAGNIVYQGEYRNYLDVQSDCYLYDFLVQRLQKAAYSVLHIKVSFFLSMYECTEEHSP